MLSKERNTIERDPTLNAFPVAAGTKVFQGALVALNAAGFAQGGTASPSLTAAGRADETADNTGGANGTVHITVRRGVFQFKNHGADPVVQADVNKDCYILDDETVAKTHAGNTRSLAGKVRGVDGAGVWVEI